MNKIKLSYIFLFLTLITLPVNSYATRVKLDPKSSQSFKVGPEAGVTWDSCEDDSTPGEVICVKSKPCNIIKRLLNIGVCETLVQTCHIYDNFHSMDCTREVHHKSNCRKVDGEEYCDSNITIRVD